MLNTLRNNKPTGSAYSTNWTHNPKNCKTMSKLLTHCLQYTPDTDSCHVYTNLLLACKNKVTEKDVSGKNVSGKNVSGKKGGW